MCLSLPLTSLGEHQIAPKQSARPISKWSVIMPIIIGVVTAKLTSMALEKLVLLKNSNNSLICFVANFKMRVKI
ncbi:hypothetical protein [Winogradskyella endarachnes]|uniref:hypothetical protein n=1 Tax=Winogradskyella endarachnes TaxID=2681965 RepID=UPI001E2A85CA|nr:hypothetical protein [Winogradskyella endarachnes]